MSGRAPQAGRVAQGRRAEQPGVFAAELRGAVIAHRMAGRAGVQPLGQDQLARLLQADLLLVLQRAERGDRLEVAMQGRGAHPRLGGQLLDAERLVEVLGDPADGPLDLAHAAVGPGDLGQARPLVAQQHAVEDLALDQRGQHGGVARRIDQADHPHHRVQQRRIDLADRHGPDQRPGVLGQGRLAAQLQQQVADHRRVQIHAETG
jgi:hypothetical protein